VGSDLDISVLLATYNRADILQGTLESMTRLDRDGLQVEFVVVDNNSTDKTKDVIESVAGRLPLRYLFEPKPGKSVALNLALKKSTLGKIVVFTDDDVVPRQDWLKKIIEVSRRWPDYSVFGGKIDLIWPKGIVPGWAHSKSVQYWAFGQHDQGDSDHPYPDADFPSGANYWVRRSVLGQARLFDGTVGPRPTNYTVMGTETSFLHGLRVDGYCPLYSPDVVLGHHVQPALLKEDVIYKRAYRWGRGMPHRGLCHAAFFEKHPWLWRVIRIVSLLRHGACYAGTMFYPLRDNRIIKQLGVVTRMGYDVESLKLSYESFEKA